MTGSVYMYSAAVYVNVWSQIHVYFKSVILSLEIDTKELCKSMSRSVYCIAQKEHQKLTEVLYSSAKWKHQTTKKKINKTRVKLK